MSINSVSAINFSTVAANPQASISIDTTGNLLLSPASGAKCNIGGVVLYTSDDTQYIQSNGFSNLCIGNGDENAIAIQTTNVITLNGLEISGGTTIQPVTSTDSITISATDITLNSLQIDASTSPTISSSGDITITPASGSKCNIGGVVLYTNDDTQYIQSNGFSNMCIGNGDENAIAIQTTNIITLNGIEISSGTTIQTSTSTDSMTLSASTLNFTPSAGYLRMSQTPYFTSVGTSAQSFTLPCGGVFLLTMVANATSGDQVSVPSLNDLWYVFSTSAATTITPYSTATVSGYYEGVNANGVIGVQSSSTANTIGVAAYQSDAYFYNFYLTMIS